MSGRPNKRLRDIWPLGRPKNPGFGIGKGFYLTVLASKVHLPTLYEIANPEGKNGAVIALAAPLQGESDPKRLHVPLERGVYAVASPDRKTVLRMMVMPKEEAGFEPEAIARSSLAEALSPDARNRLLATWTIVQLTFESHDAMVYPAVELLLNVVTRVGEASEGLIADPISQRYLTPAELSALRTAGELIDARSVVAARARTLDNGLHAFTMGMQKFDLPEFEITAIEPADEQLSREFLIGLCQTVLLSGPVDLGQFVGDPKMAFQVTAGGLDRGMWEGIPCLELIPAQRCSSSECLRAALSNVQAR